MSNYGNKVLATILLALVAIIVLAAGEAAADIEKANAEALNMITLAEAQAQVEKLQADAEAYTIKQQGTSLRMYPEVLDYTFVSQLDNVEWGIMPSDTITPLLPIRGE